MKILNYFIYKFCNALTNKTLQLFFLNVYKNAILQIQIIFLKIYKNAHYKKLIKMLKYFNTTNFELPYFKVKFAVKKNIVKACRQFKIEGLL